MRIATVLAFAIAHGGGPPAARIAFTTNQPLPFDPALPGRDIA